MLICFHSEQAEVIGVTGYQEPDRNTTALWWSHPTQCPLGLFCNDQHVWAHLPQHTSTPGYELCFVYPHIHTFGMTYYCWWLCSLSLGHFVCVFLAFIHSYTYNSIEKNFYFLLCLPPSAPLQGQWLWLMSVSKPSPSSISTDPKHRTCPCYFSAHSPLLPPHIHLSSSPSHTQQQQQQHHGG